MKNRTTLWLLLLLVALVALDQVTKWSVVASFMPPSPYGWESVQVFHTSALNLDIVRVHNRGVAFGFGNHTAWAPYVFFSIQVLALVWLVWLYRRGFFCTRMLRVSWVLVLAGVLGNMLDRLTQGFFVDGAGEMSFWAKLSGGYVVDFIDFSFPWWSAEQYVYGCYHWPAFNVADACVCVAAGLFLISSFLPAPAGSDNAKTAD